MSEPTHFLQDIYRQRVEMPRLVHYLAGEGQSSLEEASSLIRSASVVFLTGIGASWNAAVCAGSLFSLNGRPVHLQEAGELLHFAAIPRGAVVVALSRSGRSTEIVQLLAKAAAAGARVVGVTNCSDSPLARESAVAIVVPTPLDHAISVNAYTSLLIAASALASSVTGSFAGVASQLQQAVAQAGERVEHWQRQTMESGWLASNEPYVFLARGGSIGTARQAQLLWEEGVKMPATSMTTSGFRHGPQEVIRKGMRSCLWIDQAQMREQDLAVARDLRGLGVCVMLIGEGLPADAADLVCPLPVSPPHLQFVIDVLPIQLAAELLSRQAGVDCDRFRICSYVVEHEHGLLAKRSETPPDAS